MNEANLVSTATFAQARVEIGPQIGRIVGYFREDGVKSVGKIVEAMRAGDATAMVLPAHTLKGESRQLGADPLGDLCEIIENIARDCVETRDAPDQAMEHVIKLKPMFEATLAILERESNPLVERRPQFGASGGGFGRRAASF
ncbi:MAG: Hpt domain-containing protein [Pseudomonadota bacterium]